MSATAPVPTLPTGLTLAEPDVRGPLAVFPVLADPGAFEYVALAEGLARGVKVTELRGGASVNDLLVHNPLDACVLLFEGEHVAGAQQDRTVDASVLVPAGHTLQVAVSCVEHGRWDGSRHGEAFSAAPAAAYPELRRRKSAAMRRVAAAPAAQELRADQGEVWREVATKQERLGVASATGALRDAFAGHRPRVDELVAAVRRRDGQVGAVAAIGGQVVCLDLVSRPDAWAALHGPLVQGYALDAAELRDAGRPVDAHAVAGWVRDIDLSRAARRNAPGFGEHLVLEGARAAGTGLWHADELVQLSAFPADPSLPDTTPGAVARVQRPSRRRLG